MFRSPGALKDEYDIVIIGGGGHGLAAAYYLATEHDITNVAVLEKGRAGETYNIGGNNQPTNLELVRKICARLDQRFPEAREDSHERLLRFVEDRPGHDRRYAMNIDKIESELGWKPAHDFSSGMEATVRWYIDHRDWCEKVQSESRYRRERLGLS